ncbi:sterol desaturase family protein [Pedobacter sp. BS3]|uniref:sterol desaturase family protein n=1 Tax=Pedobacter sp. BS3 TaxID=2567937 RepID=UPI0011EE9A47|nr:sterol desaturase family protein [Pedobacter sp. BS3]TZF82206.1 sterol desaturase family protein [Pedobacter sp. BS3]
MNELNYLAFGIPAFFLFVILEFIAAQQKGKKHIFKYDSSVANISIGLAERLLNLFISASFYRLFYYVYTHFALFNISNTWPVWIALLLATDLVWYWYHRLGHEINILWGAHIVHHQSDEFNYTVSARITTFQALIRNLFWCILPFIGFHPALVITILLIHGAYSFFTHTQLIGKLGWLEYIFITPSLHRVHHASNEHYLNKNYGDLFVFWDKLFGTYAKEEEEPKYGLTHPLNSYSFMWQHFHYFLEIAEACTRVNGLAGKLRIIFGRPEDMDQDIRPELEKKYLPYKRKDQTSQKFRVYLNIQIGVCVTLLFIFTLVYNYLSIPDKVFGALFIIITLINCGALLEQRRWIYYLEFARLLIVAGYLSILWDTYSLLITALLLLFVLDATTPAQRWYIRLLYDPDN